MYRALRSVGLDHLIGPDFEADQRVCPESLGNWNVSGIAALPRIVTLHDIDIKPDNKDAYDQLSLELTAKTYRYLDEDEIAAGEAEKKKDTHHPQPTG